MNSTTLSLHRSDVVVITETAFITAVTLMILAGNSVTILVLRSARCWEDNASLLLQNLALADFGVGLFMTWTAIYISGSRLEEWPYGAFMCKMSSYLGNTCCMVSIMTLALISVERYLLLVKPLKYCRHMTSQTVVYLSALTWLIGTILLIPAFLPNGTTYNINSYLCSYNFGGNTAFTLFILCVVFMPSNVTIMYTYGCTIMTVRRHHRQIRAQQEAIGNICQEQQQEYNHKAISTFLIITGAFNLAWVPYVGLAMMRTLSEIKTFPHWVEFLFPWLAMSNSFANTIIYLTCNPPFRRQVKKLFIKKLFRSGTKVSPLG